MVRSTDDPTVYSGILSGRCGADASSVYTDATPGPNADKYSASNGNNNVKITSIAIADGASGADATINNNNNNNNNRMSSSNQHRDLPPSTMPASPGGNTVATVGTTSTIGTSASGGILRNGNGTKSSSSPAQSYECDYDANPTKLYMLIQEKNWDDAAKRCETHLVDAATWISRREKNGRLRWRLLPLHAAVIFKAPVPVIESLLCSYPRAASQKDDQGMLPVHLAFRNGSSVDVVQLLLVAYPQGINAKDRKGRIPLVLAQASTSPNRDAFVEALQKGPSYYAVAGAAAAASDRTADAVSEQRSAYETRLDQQRETYETKLDQQRSTYESTIEDMEHRHQEEMEALRASARSTAEAVTSATDLSREVDSLRDELDKARDELDKARDTSQVLVDHVTTLEDQIKSKDETEQILTEQIHNLKKVIDELNAELDDKSSFMEQERDAAITENVHLKASLRKTEDKLETAKQDILNQTVQSTRAISSRDDDRKRLESELKQLESEVATAKASIMVMETQLKKKVMTEQALTTQVGDLAQRLVETNDAAQVAEDDFKKRIVMLEEERDGLTQTVDALTETLTDVAAALDDMAAEQDKIVEAASAHEVTMAHGIEVQKQLVEDATQQAAKIEQARTEREQIAAVLERQAEELDRTWDERKRIMEAVTAQDEGMRSAAEQRRDLVARIRMQKESMRILKESGLQIVESSNDVLQQAKSTEQDYQQQMDQLRKERDEALEKAAAAKVAPTAPAAPVVPTTPMKIDAAAQVPLPPTPRAAEVRSSFHQRAPVSQRSSPVQHSVAAVPVPLQASPYVKSSVSESRSVVSLAGSIRADAAEQIQSPDPPAHKSVDAPEYEKDYEKEMEKLRRERDEALAKVSTTTKETIAPVAPATPRTAYAAAQVPLPTSPYVSEERSFDMTFAAPTSPVQATVAAAQVRASASMDRAPSGSAPSSQMRVETSINESEAEADAVQLQLSPKRPANGSVSPPISPPLSPMKIHKAPSLQLASSIEGRPPIPHLKSSYSEYNPSFVLSKDSTAAPYGISGQMSDDQYGVPVESLTTEELIEEGTNVLRQMPSLAGRDSEDGSQEGSEGASSNFSRLGCHLRHPNAIANEEDDESGEAYGNEVGERKEAEVHDIEASDDEVKRSEVDEQENELDEDEDAMEREARELEEQLAQLQAEHTIYSVVALESNSLLESKSFRSMNSTASSKR